MAVVIEEGIGHEVICWSCKSKIGYSKAERKWGDFNCDYLGDCDRKQYIECPKCGEAITGV